MWWKKSEITPKARAIAYYRHSAQDRQENSIPLQKEQVQQFAKDNNIEIIAHFQDEGKSGLSTEGRDDFNRALEFVASGKKDFQYVLVLDMSRWGRFQDIDMSAFYRGLCKQYGKEVVYTKIGFKKDDDLLHYMQLNIESYQAARYSRELSDKVFRGCVKIAQQGFRAGGLPPYGLNRLLLDEKRQPVQVLQPGQRKSIQNQRVTLAPGNQDEVAVIKRIFHEYVKLLRKPRMISDALNADGVSSPGGSKWNSGTVLSILSNELYIGTMVYNKTGQRLQSPTVHNPTAEWVRTENAFQPVVDKSMFFQAQELLQARKAEHELKYSNREMILRLKEMYAETGIINQNQIKARRYMVSAATYSKHFTSLDMAFQNMYAEVLDSTKQSVMSKIQKHANRIELFKDYVVINDSLSIVIQPSVPVPIGYKAYWCFRPDKRSEVDVTLGVPLSNNGNYEILGYLAFPRIVMTPKNVRLFSTSDEILDLFGYRTLDLIGEIA